MAYVIFSINSCEESKGSGRWWKHVVLVLVIEDLVSGAGMPRIGPNPWRETGRICSKRHKSLNLCVL